MNKIQLTTYKSIIGSLALETVNNPNNTEDIKSKDWFKKIYKVYKKLYAKCLDKEGNSKHSRFTNKKFSELNLKSIYISKYFKGLSLLKTFTTRLIIKFKIT